MRLAALILTAAVLVGCGGAKGSASPNEVRACAKKKGLTVIEEDAPAGVQAAFQVRGPQTAVVVAFFDNPDHAKQAAVQILASIGGGHFKIVKSVMLAWPGASFTATAVRECL